MGSVFSFERYVMIEMAVVLISAIFLIWRRPQRRLRLKLKSVSDESRRLDGQRFPVDYRPRTGARVHTESSHRPDTLNVHFNYNGHSFDAYEVLGLPAGCSWGKVEDAYKTASRAADAPSKDFLQAALAAIEKHLKNHAA